MPHTAKVAQTVEPAAPQSRVTDTVQENTSSLEHAQFQARMRGMNIPPNGSRASINQVVQRIEAGGQHPLQKHEDFMYLQRTIGNQAVIRLLDSMRKGGNGGIHETAAAGVRGTGSPLPHLDKIQHAFGQHDISGVQAFTGTKAAMASKTIGAEAYTRGNKIAFSSPSPDLHTTAHEAAHVLQQRAGVRLNCGVGKIGDNYERHADAVADRVVMGQSAAGLINQPHGVHGSSPMPPGSFAQRKVNRYSQPRGLVKPTRRLQGAINTNDPDPLLRRANRMGGTKMPVPASPESFPHSSQEHVSTPPVAPAIQLQAMFGYELQFGNWKIGTLANQKVVLDESFMHKGKPLKPISTDAVSVTRDGSDVELITTPLPLISDSMPTLDGFVTDIVTAVRQDATMEAVGGFPGNTGGAYYVSAGPNETQDLFVVGKPASDDQLKCRPQLTFGAQLVDVPVLMREILEKDQHMTINSQTRESLAKHYDPNRFEHSPEGRLTSKAEGLGVLIGASAGSIRNQLKFSDMEKDHQVAMSRISFTRLNEIAGDNDLVKSTASAPFTPDERNETLLTVQDTDARDRLAIRTALMHKLEVGNLRGLEAAITGYQARDFINDEENRKIHQTTINNFIEMATDQNADLDSDFLETGGGKFETAAREVTAGNELDATLLELRRFSSEQSLTGALKQLADVALILATKTQALTDEATANQTAPKIEPIAHDLAPSFTATRAEERIDVKKLIAPLLHLHRSVSFRTKGPGPLKAIKTQPGVYEYSPYIFVGKKHSDYTNYATYIAEIEGVVVDHTPQPEEKWTASITLADVKIVYILFPPAGE